MRCSLKVISLGKMRGVENLSKTKKGLTAIGIIMIFGAVIPLLHPQIILSVANYLEKARFTHSSVLASMTFGLRCESRGA